MSRTSATRALRAYTRGMSGNRLGTGVPFATKAASVLQVSNFAPRRAKPISLPIVLGSTFELDDCAHGARLHAKKEAPYADGDGYVYSRWGSPTNEGAARQLAALEGLSPDDAGGCMLFSSGMCAISSALLAVLKSGDHAIVPYTVYGGTHEFLQEFAVHWGIEVHARPCRLGPSAPSACPPPPHARNPAQAVLATPPPTLNPPASPLPPAQVTFVDATDAANYASALKPNTKVRNRLAARLPAPGTPTPCHAHAPDFTAPIH